MYVVTFVAKVRRESGQMMLGPMLYPPLLRTNGSVEYLRHLSVKVAHIPRGSILPRFTLSSQKFDIDIHNVNIRVSRSAIHYQTFINITYTEHDFILYDLEQHLNDLNRTKHYYKQN